MASYRYELDELLDMETDSKSTIRVCDRVFYSELDKFRGRKSSTKDNEWSNVIERCVESYERSGLIRFLYAKVCMDKVEFKMVANLIGTIIERDCTECIHMYSHAAAMAHLRIKYKNELSRSDLIDLYHLFISKNIPELRRDISMSEIIQHLQNVESRGKEMIKIFHERVSTLAILIRKRTVKRQEWEVAKRRLDDITTCNRKFCDSFDYMVNIEE